MANGSVVNRVVRRSGPIDVHVISSRPDEAGGTADDERRLPVVKPVLTPLSPRRQAWGWAIALIGLPGLAVLFANARDTFSLSTVLLAYLMLAMVVALVGGGAPRRVRRGRRVPDRQLLVHAAVYRLTIQAGENLVSLVVYVVAAGMVACSSIGSDAAGSSRPGAGRGRGAGGARRVDGRAGLARRHARQGARHLRFPVGCPPRRPRRGLARAGGVGHRAAAPARAGRRHRDLGGITLALAGGALSAEDQRVLNAFAAQVAAAAESQRLHVEAGRATELAAANDLRARSCRRCRTTCAPRWRRSRRRSPACASPTSTGRPT